LHLNDEFDETIKKLDVISVEEPSVRLEKQMNKTSEETKAKRGRPRAEAKDS